MRNSTSFPMLANRLFRIGFDTDDNAAGGSGSGGDGNDNTGNGDGGGDGPDSSGAGSGDDNSGGDTGGGSGSGDQTGTEGNDNTGSGNDDNSGGKTYDEQYVKKLRNEAASHRTKAQQAEQAHTDLVQTVGKALGLVEEENDADPEKLKQTVAEREAEARATKVELAVFRRAGKYAADADALLDSRSFIGQVGKLDPASDTFETDLESAIDKAVQANPKLKAQTQAAGRTGGDFEGGSGDKPPANQLSVEDQRKQRRKRRELDHEPS